MGRLIDEEELQEYIIHEGCEKGCGYIDERDLKYIPTVEAIPKADYEARLKADVVAMLKEIKDEANNIRSTIWNCTSFSEGISAYNNLIQQKIDKLKEDEESG